MTQVTAPKEGIDLSKKLQHDDQFKFECGPHVPCFTECCGKLELLLTPYDILRLKTRLRMTADDFLEQYGIMRRRTAHGFPEFLMQMNPETKRCPFVTENGCTVYEDRPAACRIYPLGRASTRHPMTGENQEFYFTVREAHCKGFDFPREWQVREWLSDQDLETYNRTNDLLMDLYVMNSRNKSIEITPQHIQMFIMSLYNLEKFRDFIFKSPFLQRFELDPSQIETMRSDDLSLLEFAFSWLKFAIFREPTLKIRD